MLNYDDGNGNWRFRLNRYFVTTCDGINCNYTKKNGMDESSATDRAGLRDSLSGSRIEKCAAEYYLIEDAKCYPQAKAVGNPSATLKVNDCKKLTAYRTTVKITSDGANSWYYYPTKDCYIEGTKLRGSAPSACNPPASSPTPSNNSSNTYYVYINGGGAICNNSSHCQNTGSYQTLKITYTGSIYISTLNSILIYDKCNLTSVGGRTLYLDWQENGLSLTAQWDCTTGNGSWCYICNPSYSWGISSYKATYPAGKAPGYCRFSSTSTNDCY